MTRPRFRSTAISLLLLSMTSPLIAQTVVVPNSFAAAEAPASNSIPFGTDLFCSNGIRYQQVYADAQVGTTGALTAVRFRLDGGELDPLPLSTYSGTTISVSTAANGPTTFSSEFAENIGPDAVDVFVGDLILSAPGGGASPKPFDVEIVFQTPFIYRGGDLLIDFRIQGCPDPGVFFDRADGTDVSLTRRITADDVDATTANSGSGVGLVTQLEFGPLPDIIFEDRFEG